MSLLSTYTYIMKSRIIIAMLGAFVFLATSPTISAMAPPEQNEIKKAPNLGIEQVSAPVFNLNISEVYMYALTAETSKTPFCPVLFKSYEFEVIKLIDFAALDWRQCVNSYKYIYTYQIDSETPGKAKLERGWNKRISSLIG